MRILVDSGELSDAVAHVARILDRDRPGMLLACDGTGLVLESSGDGQWSQARVAGDVVDGGRVTVNGMWLNMLTRVMPACELTLDTDAGYVELQGGEASLRMRVASDDLLPERPALPGQAHPVDAVGFESLCRSVVDAAGATRDRPVLAAVRFTCDGSVLTATATNRYQAARRRMEASLPEGEWLADADWLKRNMRGVTGVGVADRLMLLEAGAYRDAVTLVAGEYPDVDRLWDPAGEAGRIDVDRIALLEAARMLRGICLYRADVIPLALDAHEGLLRVRYSGDGDDADSMGVRLLQAGMTGDIRVEVNADYLIVALQAMDADTVTLHCNGIRPLLIGQEDGMVDQLVNTIRR